MNAQTLEELFDLMRQGRATGPVVVRRERPRVVWEDREQVDRVMRQRPVGKSKREDRMDGR